MLENGTTASLFDAGKSMADHKIQDQDGLGICYSNSTSAILSSLLPGNPEISYSHAALKASTHSYEETWNSEGGGKYLLDGGKVFNSSNSICKAVQGLKKAGGACPKKFSLTEKHELVDPEVQYKLYAGLGAYFDKMNTINSDPDQAKKSKEDLVAIIKAIRDHKEKLKIKCEEEKADDLPVTKGLGDILKLTVLLAKKQNPCEVAVAESAKKLAAPDSYIGSDRVNITPKPEIIKDLKDEIKSNPQLAKTIQEYVVSSKEDDPVDSIIKELNPLIHKVLLKHVPNESLKECDGLDPAKSPIVSTHTEDDEMIKSMRSAKRDECNTFLPDYKIKEEESELRAKVAEAEGIKGCVPLEKQDEILKAVLPLMEAGVAVDDAMIDALADPVVRNARQLEKALMPGCLDKNNLINMDDISCRTKMMCDWKVPDKDKSYRKFEGLKDTCLGRDHAVRTYRSTVFEGIKEGRAIGVTICTDFLKDPKANTQYCQKKSNIPNHVMTISGYRCIKGKVQYELVNSWGAEHCPVEAVEDKKSGKKVYRNSALECELDEDGNPTGKYWVNESSLINNSRDLSVVEKKGP